MSCSKCYRMGTDTGEVVICSGDCNHVLSLIKKALMAVTKQKDAATV
jgi:hypothetical protein